MVNSELSWEVTVRKKVVDATYMHVMIPSRRPPPYAVEPGALCIPPNHLPSITKPHPKYIIIGAGKTGIDAVLWMLRNGVAPAQLYWVKPRDAWYVCRKATYPATSLTREE